MLKYVKVCQSITEEKMINICLNSIVSKVHLMIDLIKKSPLNEKEQDILRGDEMEREKIDAVYDSYVNGATDSAIKNGVSRSSILDGEKEKLSNEKEKDLDVLEYNTQSAINENERDKSFNKR